MPDRELTDNEQRLVNVFESMKPGFGARVKHIFSGSNTTRWIDLFADTREEGIEIDEDFLNRYILNCKIYR